MYTQKHNPQDQTTNKQKDQITFSEVALESARHITEIPHTSSSGCLPTNRFHTPVIWIYHIIKFLHISQLQLIKTIIKRKLLLTNISWREQQGKHKQSIGSFGDGSCDDHSVHIECVFCSFFYQNYLFLFPVVPINQSYTYYIHIYAEFGNRVDIVKKERDYHCYKVLDTLILLPRWRGRRL